MNEDLEEEPDIGNDPTADYENDPQPTDPNWPRSLAQCLLQVSQELNITSDLTSRLEALVYNSSSQEEYLTEDELYFQFLNSTALWGGENNSVWGGVGGSRVAECLGSASQVRPYLLPWWQQLTWTLAFGSMLLVAIGGNALVMWIVIAHRRMRTVTNYFLVNLSLADLLMSVLNCIFNFIYMLHSDWPFGSIYCTISNFMANVTIAASVFTLMAISFDRYIAIVRPLKPRMTKSEARYFIIFIWASSMMLALPCLLYSTTVSIRYKNDEIRRGCFLLWPDGETSVSYREYVYNIVFFSTTYLLPMLVLLISYTLISFELWGSHSIGELTDRQANAIKSKRRVVRMFIVIVVVFMLCWLPQQAFFLYQYHNSQVLDTANIQHIYLGFYWLAMANAMINPIIYYWMNARFRAYFREVVVQCTPVRCCCFCSSCVKNSGYLDSPHLVRRRHDSADHTSRSRSDVRLDVNGIPRPIVGGGSRPHNHLLVYSSRGRSNGRGANSQYCNSRTGAMHTESVPMRDLRFLKSPEGGDGPKKPLRAEQDWHHIQYLSDQKTLRSRIRQIPMRPLRNVNGLQAKILTVNSDDLPGVRGEEMEMKLLTGVERNSQEDSDQICVADIQLNNNSHDGEGTRCLPKILTSLPDPSTEFSSLPNSFIKICHPNSGASDCSVDVHCISNINCQPELKGNSCRIPKVRSSSDPGRSTTNKDALKSTSEGGMYNGNNTKEEEMGTKVKKQNSTGSIFVSTLKGHYPELKYLNGNMVHQAIEETLSMVSQRQGVSSSTRDENPIRLSTVYRSSSIGSFQVSEELML